MINANHGSVFGPHTRDIAYLEELASVKKSKLISVFCSSKEWRPEYRLRLQFVEYLQRHFGADLEWFGNGVNEIPEKWDGLAPFEYTIVLENRSDRGIFTEKILDPFLSLTEPIYWGDPNIRNVLPISPQNLIDIRDFAGSRATIERIIGARKKRRSSEVAFEGKSLVLGKLHFLQRIIEMVETSSTLSRGCLAAREVTLQPLKCFTHPDVPAAELQRESFETRLYRNARALYRGGKKMINQMKA